MNDLPKQALWTVPDHVLFRQLEDEAVLLNLETELYFGLNEVGTAVWNAIADGGTLEAAWAELAPQYDVDPAVLRRDMLKLLEELVAHGLLKSADS